MRASRSERGIRWALSIALALALAHPFYRALHLGVEYFDGYEYLCNARALVGDPLCEYQLLRPPLVPILQTPAMAIVRASPPADPIRLIVPHLTGALVSILSTSGLFWLFSRSYGITLALLGILLFASSRYFVHYGPHVMADLPSAGWAAATIALYLRARERKTTTGFVLCGLALGFGVLTKFPLFVLGFALLLSELWLAALARRMDRRCAWGVVTAGAVGVATFLAVQLVVMWIISGAAFLGVFWITLRHLPTMSGVGEVPGESWLDYGAMTTVMLSLPTLMLAGAGILLALRRPEARDIPCLATLAATGGTTLFMVTHTEARYLLPAVPFLLYFALRSVEALWGFARERWQAWGGLRRGALIAGGALLLAVALRVGVHQAILEEDPLYRADLERRAVEKLLAARGEGGRLLWHGLWYTLPTRFVRLVPHDEFFGVFHFPAFAVPYLLDQPLDHRPMRWPTNPDELALVLEDGDAVLRTADIDYDATRLPAEGLPPMEVRSAHSRRFRARSDSELVDVKNPDLRIRIQPDGRTGVLSGGALSGRWQVLLGGAPDGPRRYAGHVTLTPGEPAELPLHSPEPVREVELFQLQATRIE
jgi:4-amino-4-deoxy-L-arabinose transferase-like glycosyltransferase